MSGTQFVAAAVVLAAISLPAFSQDGSLQQSFGSKFVLTEVTKDRSAIVKTGTPLTLQADNLLMYSTVCPSSPLNAYTRRSSKLSQPFGKSFLRDLGGSMKMSGGATTADCPQQRFVRGARLWVTRIDVQKDAILFHLYTQPDGDALYYGDLRFSFEKGLVPAPSEALAMVAEALTPDAAAAAVAPEPALTPAVSLQLPATYVKSQAPADHLELNADHTFSLQVGDQAYRGTFETDGRTLQLIFPPDTKSTGTLQGNEFVDDNGDTWVLREPAPPTAGGTRVLRNADLVKMARAGLSDNIIIAAIHASQCQFETSPDALIDLKQAGVSDAVLTAVVSK